MSLYVLRYGTERGKGEYHGVHSGVRRQADASRWTRARARRVAEFIGARLVRLRPKRTLLGYVVRLEWPGEPPRWVTAGALHGTTRPQERYVYSRVRAESAARLHNGSRVVPVYLRARP